MSRKIAISDIHGCLQTFKCLVEIKIKLQVQDELYLLGDYIDRGPDSKGVIDYIFHLRETGFQVHCLLGNHEQMMMDGVESISSFSFWRKNGGKQTLDSFNALDLEGDAIPKRHWAFMLDCQHYIEVDNYILVHGGLNFKKADPFSDTTSMLWERNWYHRINKNWLRGRIIVHGHTPISKKNIIQQFDSIDSNQYLDIDAGCFRKGQHGFGHLCAFDMTNKTLHFQPNVDAVDWR